MSYCVALQLKSGIVFMATFPYAGVDNISHYQKIHNWSKPNERQFFYAAGNLATSQSVKPVSEEVDDDLSKTY